MLPGTMSAPSDGSESVRIKVGFVTVEAAVGDIVEETTDAIVNSTNDIMDLTGQVSKALVRKGGTQIQADCKKRGKIGDVGVFAASAQGTSLKCKFLIHVDIDKSAGNLVKSCFNEADRLKLQSVSLPVLGTGNHKAAPEAIIPGLISGVREFLCESGTPLHLRLIRFVVYQQNMMSVFKNSMMVALGRAAVLGEEVPVGLDVSHCLPEAAMPLPDTASEPFSFEVPSTTLTDNRMNELRQHAALHGVHVTFNKGMGFVTLSCSDHAKRNTVYEYIKQSSEELQDQEALQRRVQWQFLKDGTEWVNYSPSVNLKIEMAQRAGQTSLTYTSGIGTFVVDLRRNRDYLTTDEEYCANIRRLDKVTRP